MRLLAVCLVVLMLAALGGADAASICGVGVQLVNTLSPIMTSTSSTMVRTECAGTDVCEYKYSGMKVIAEKWTGNCVPAAQCSPGGGGSDQQMQYLPATVCCTDLDHGIGTVGGGGCSYKPANLSVPRAKCSTSGVF
jgi:hypothetical protein